MEPNDPRQADGPGRGFYQSPPRARRDHDGGRHGPRLRHRIVGKAPAEPPARYQLSDDHGAHPISRCGPEDVEERVTERLQEALAATSNLVRIWSVSRAEVSDIVLEFAWGTRITFAMQDVRESWIASSSRRRPKSRFCCVTTRTSIRSSRWGIGEPDLRKLRRLARDDLKRELEGCRGRRRAAPRRSRRRGAGRRRHAGDRQHATYRSISSASASARKASTPRRERWRRGTRNSW